MAQVIPFHDPKNPIIPPDEILEKAKGVFKEILVIGHDEDGNFIARASDGSKLLCTYLAEKFKSKLLNGDFDVV